MCSAKTPLEMFSAWNLDNAQAKDFVSKFWEGQDKMLDSMQKFSAGWFDRRHVGTKAAIDASLHACQAKNPADMFACYQDWAAGAASRILDDQRAYQQLVQTVISSIASELPELQIDEEPLPLVRPKAA
jgi:hypothetical protein